MFAAYLQERWPTTPSLFWIVELVSFSGPTSTGPGAWYAAMLLPLLCSLLASGSRLRRHGGSAAEAFSNGARMAPAWTWRRKRRPRTVCSEFLVAALLAWIGASLLLASPSVSGPSKWRRSRPERVISSERRDQRRPAATLLAGGVASQLFMACRSTPPRASSSPHLTRRKATVWRWWRRLYFQAADAVFR